MNWMLTPYIPSIRKQEKEVQTLNNGVLPVDAYFINVIPVIHILKLNLTFKIH